MTMRIAFFDAHGYERSPFDAANVSFGHALSYLEPRLTEATATLALRNEAVCCFVNDRLNASVLSTLRAGNVRLVALRCAGFNNVDLHAAAELGIAVTRVPEYSPHAVAEHTIALVLALDRKIHRAHARVREGNFSLEGLVGFDLYQKTIGIIGTGRIGRAAARIFRGFGCSVLGFDVRTDPHLEIEYVSLDELYARSDIVSLHVPLTPQTHHLLDARALATMKRGVMLINTSRGALLDTRALIQALKSGHVGSAGLDVYEEEEGVFFTDLSDRVLEDDVLARLLTFPNVVVTSHQAFLTHEALANIAASTLESVSAFERGSPLANVVRAVGPRPRPRT